MSLVRVTLDIGSTAISITFNAGLGRTLTREFDDGTTLGQALEVALPALNMSNGNVSSSIAGMPVGTGMVLTDGQTIALETASHSKAN